MNDVLRRWRFAKGLTRSDLAAVLGVTSTTIGRWETGTRQIAVRRVAQISQLTGIPVAELRPDLAGLMRVPE